MVPKIVAQNIDFDWNLDKAITRLLRNSDGPVSLSDLGLHSSDGHRIDIDETEVGLYVYDWSDTNRTIGSLIHSAIFDVIIISVNSGPR